MSAEKKNQRETRLLHCGKPRPQPGKQQPVNPPVMRGSTVVFHSVADWRASRTRRDHQQELSYGARGTETAFALENALTELEGGYRAQLYPTGLAAIASVLLALLKPGQHLLISDAVYTPVRKLITDMLIPFGIECEFYAADGSDLADRIKPHTAMIYSEIPGSLMYEMLDFAELVRLAKSAEALVVVDNTWASGWLFSPLEHGADVSLLAVTKYIGGHADLVLGAAVCNEATFGSVSNAAAVTGQTCSPDDAALALRGLRTLGTRLQRHHDTTLEIAGWLQQRPEIRRVYCPMLPGDPGYPLWKKYFSGGNGLLTIEFDQASAAQRDHFLDRLELFDIGASWGGYECLCLPVDPQSTRCVSDWSGHGHFARLHIGLEAAADIKADLEQALLLMNR